MAGIDDLIAAFPQLAPIANALGMQKTVKVEPELPLGVDDIHRYNRERFHREPLYAIPKSTIPTDLPPAIEVYRADPTGRYGGKEGLETQPLSRLIKGGNTVGKTQMYEPDLNPETSTIYTNPSKAIQELYRYARLNGAATKHGHAAFTPEEIAAFMLKEGRTDLGMGGVSFGNKKDMEYDQMLRDTYLLPFKDQNFLAAIGSKKRVADKLGISLAEAWNGTGVNEAGQSGKQYAKNWEDHKKAALHPKNKQLLEVIQRGIADGQKFGLPLKTDETKYTSTRFEKKPYKKGGAVNMPDEYSQGKWKLI
jgi:hypothetical protein